MRKKTILFAFYFVLTSLFFFPHSGFSQQPVPIREIIPLDGLWSFAKDSLNRGAAQIGPGEWGLVSLPHSWNVLDASDDIPGYYRNTTWYRRTFLADASWKGQEVSLCLDGVNQEAVVYLNGQEVGRHEGGYTAFRFSIGTYLRGEGENELLIRVSNQFNEQIPPLTADFTFFGGIYRKVYLNVCSPIHFADPTFGGDGLFLSTPKVSVQEAEVKLSGMVSNQTEEERTVILRTEMLDAEGKLIKTLNQTIHLPAHVHTSVEQQVKGIQRPVLWSPEHPYLYRVVTSLVDERGKVLDQLIHSLGFRWFHFDAKQGFFLNGKPYKLMGVSRHQDYQGKGNAVEDSLQVQDIRLLKQMGGNFLRVAHYPQSQAVLDACDRLGILTSVEIPVVNEITESQEFFDRCLFMQREMIHQYFNHSSIIIWGYMNEVLLRPHFTGDSVRQRHYFGKVKRLAQALDSLTRREDPSRYTMIANHGNVELYHRVGLTEIPMLVGWNLYQGWYGGQIRDFGTQLDRIHQQFPDKPFLVTEYGADADPRIHRFDPVRFDKSIEYAILYHQGYIQDVMNRPFVAGAAVWNLADFHSETREESMPHINTKGLLTWDRKPKNSYYLYQASLKKEPFLKIGTWVNRAGKSLAEDSVCWQALQVFSNTDRVKLWMNGKSYGEQPVKQGVATWTLPFVQGKNRIETKAAKGMEALEDRTEIDFTLYPDRCLQGTCPLEWYISVGDNRYITDAEGHVWMPDQAYRPGSWGSIGGKDFRLKNSGRQNLGSDRNIWDTAEDPIFQTQQIGLSGYRLDVPSGSYELTLCFAELEGGKAKEQLLYDLGEKGQASTSNGARRFDVRVNGKLFLEDLNLAEQVGVARAYSHSVKIEVKGQEGIQINFDRKEGIPVLNGLVLKRVSAALQ